MVNIQLIVSWGSLILYTDTIEWNKSKYQFGHRWSEFVANDYLVIVLSDTQLKDKFRFTAKLISYNDYELGRDTSMYAMRVVESLWIFNVFKKY